VGKGLTPDVITRFALAFGTFSKGGTLVIGSDTRPSGEMVRHAVYSGLLGTGCTIIDLGVCPTPTILYNVKALKAEGGIAITASHNPVEWNAMKFIGKRATFLERKQAEELIRIYSCNRMKMALWNQQGKIVKDDAGIRRHIDAILSLPFVNTRSIRIKKFRVAIDCVNGAGWRAFPELLTRLGCEVIRVFCDGSGDFKRNPEPLAENLYRLAQMVKRKGADLGFATDADGDRLSIVSETGVALGEEYSLPLAARFVLSRKKGNYVVNFSSSRMNDLIARMFSVKLFRAKVGEANVVKKMKQVKAVIGGEGNGGIILPELLHTRDALLGMVLILGLLCETKETISQLVDDLPVFCIVKKRKRIRKGQKLNLKRVRSQLEGGRASRVDGLRIDWKDRWVHIRKSGTEPIVRIIAEAETKKEAEALCMKVMRIIG